MQLCTFWDGHRYRSSPQPPDAVGDIRILSRVVSKHHLGQRRYTTAAASGLGMACYSCSHCTRCPAIYLGAACPELSALPCSEICFVVSGRLRAHAVPSCDSDAEELLCEVREASLQRRRLSWPETLFSVATACALVWNRCRIIVNRFCFS